MNTVTNVLSRPIAMIRSSLRLKLIISFFIIILLIGGISILSFSTLRTYLTKEDGLIERTIEANKIAASSKAITDITNGSLLTNMPDYSDKKNRVFGELDSIKQDIGTLDAVLDDREARVCLAELTSLVSGYETVLDSIFDSSEKNNLNETALQKEQSRKMAVWIQNSVAELISSELSYQQAVKQELNRNANLIGFWAFGLIVLISIFSIIYAFIYSNRVGGDISNLAHAARRFADGNLNIDKFQVRSRDEVSILAESFKYMVNQIRKLIGSMEEKAIIESRLNEQEIKTLEYSNLLNQAELRFLQSQINPHFLFNTMNTIASMAKVQKADNIKKMIDSVCDILRYNLKKLDQTVTLGEEYEIVRNYCYIQEVRFGDKMKFVFEVDDSTLSYKVPSMILQPFVENSVIHGLEPKEEKGFIVLKITKAQEQIAISIIDDGIGMNREVLEDIRNNRGKLSGASKSGIGVNNVIRRLELTYGRNVVDIDSWEGKGTEVRIVLDKAEETDR